MKRFLPYGLAIIISTSAIALRYYYSSYFTDKIPYLLLVFAAFLSTSIGGFLPGILALFITSYMGIVLFATPDDFLSPSFVTQIILYFIIAFLTILITSWLRRSKIHQKTLRNRFETIVSSIGDAVICVDVEGNVLYLNPAAEQLTGWNSKTAQKKLVSEVMPVIHEHTREHISPQLNTDSGSGENKHMVLLSKDGREIHIHDSIAPIRNRKGTIVGAVIVFRDVTEKKQLEEHRDLVIGMASHELKNNITGIHGYLQLLKRSFQQEKIEKSRQYITKLDRKIGILASIITGMLDISRLEAGTFHIKQEEYDINSVIQHVLSDNEEIVKQHTIIVDGMVKGSVRGDTIRISQVLTNLLSNAVKYSPLGTEIIISVTQNATEAIIGIKDVGQGISREAQQDIFKPFYRAGDIHSQEKISGSGLGLYISYEIIKHNNGRMWVESEEGKGSIFYFTVPLAYPKTEVLIGNNKSDDLFTKLTTFFSKLLQKNS